MDYFDFRNVSIHAPTKGATRTGKGNWSLVKCFNPRSHEGSDKKGRLNMSEQYVSIHAPTKGATHSGRTGFNGKCVSIHAPTKGATGNSLRLSLISMFQSTLPRRERLPLSKPSDSISAFQSTLPRRERRSMNDMDRSGYTVSIHAPTKGATIPLIDVYRYGLLFQSTLPRRERQQNQEKNYP